METEPTVSSELYTEKQYFTKNKPSCDPKNVVSQFTFTLPPSTPKYDEDGDLVLDRRQTTQKGKSHMLQIEHSDKTVLDLVGLQIWRGALLLADWLIYDSRSLSGSTTVMELGSGVGLTTVVASMFAPVVCTDIEKGGILPLIKTNIEKNKSYVKHPVIVKALDFTQPFSKEIEEVLPHVKVILAADVIYDDEITLAFVKTLVKILEKPPSRTIYIALEKRYVFVVDGLMTNAPCYDYFVECLGQLRQIKGVVFEEQPLDFPQYFEYDRVKQLVL